MWHATTWIGRADRGPYYTHNDLENITKTTVSADQVDNILLDYNIFNRNDWALKFCEGNGKTFAMKLRRTYKM